MIVGDGGLLTGSARRQRSLRALVGVLSLALVGTILVAVTAPTRAYAAGTVLFQNSFATNTVSGNSTVTIPTPVSSTNAACLTAAGNPSTGPLLSCPSNTDPNGSGKLRFTRAVANQVGGIYGATSFPTSNGLDVTFNTYQYGGTAADGMSFALAAVDPANPVAPTAIGPSGGALGYSNSGSVAGLPNAYLGVGLDVYGNFSGSTSQGSGCTTNPNINAQVPGAVVVRGPGRGTVGYCGLRTTYTGTTASRVTLRATTRAASVVPVQVLINPSPAEFTSDTGVSVASGQYKVVATPVGGTTRTLTGTLPTVPTSLYPSSTWLTSAGIPKQLAFGFIGSTGSVTDFHEASDVKVVTFNAVAQLGVAATAYTAANPAVGAPVNYVVTPSVQTGVDVATPITMTQTVPAGVKPLEAYGTGWSCADPSGQTITCTTTGSSFADGATLPRINVVAIVTGGSVTSATVGSGSISAVSATDAGPASVTSTPIGTLPAAPSGLSLSRSLGAIGNSAAVTISGSNLTSATAIEIGTSAEYAAGTPTVLVPCSTTTTTGCFTVSGNTLVVSSWPTRSSAATTTVSVIGLGVSGSTSYVYANAPATPAAPTATAGVTSASVDWSAPAANGSPITGYTVIPYLAGVAQTPVSYDASSTDRTLTGLVAGGSYTFTVTATNAFGTSGASPPSTAVVPYSVPAAPTVSSAVAGTGRAVLTWSTPAANGSRITGYVVTPYIAGVAQTPITFATAANTQTVTGLTAGTAYTFTVAAINAAGTGPASAPSSIVTPNAAPTLTFAAPPSGQVAVSYSQQLTVTNGTAPFSWAVTGGSLPPGLTLSSSGLLSGTPTAAGSSTFTVQVTDASGSTASRSLTVTIAAAPSISFTPAAGEVSVAYSQQPTLTGGTGPITWSITAGSLPAGLTISPTTGLISGTPTASGSFSVTIAATDAFNVTAQRTVTIVIAALPTFTATTPPAGQIGVGYSTVLEVTGGTAPLTWALAAGSLPPGLSLNASNGTLSGTPTTAGSYSFTVRVTDAFDQTATKAVTLIVNPGALVFTKTANVSSTVPGATVGYTITLSNSSGAALAATFTDPLTGVLDDAAYNGNATASTGSLSYSASTLTWNGTVPANGSVTVGYSVAVANPVTGNKVLTNTVRSTTPGTNCGATSTDTRCTATVTVSGLSIVTSTDVATITPGGVVRYTVVVTNSGQTPYVGASLTDNLSGVLDDATYNADASATAGSLSYAGPNLTWTGNLAVGASATITFSVTVADPDPGNRSLTSTITSAAAGSNCPGGNPAAACSATVTVLVPALAITHTGNVSTTVPGGTVSYTATLANTGQTAYTATEVTIALTGALDDATYADDVAASAGSVAYAPRVITWTGNLAVGAVVTVTYSLVVRNPDPGDRTLTTVARSSAPGSTCPPGGGNPGCTSTVTVAIPALTITKTADAVTTTPGSVVRYTVVATNTGQTPYTGAGFADSLTGVLDDATYNNDVTATTGAAAYGSSTVTWTGDLGVGASATISYSVTVRDPDPGDRSLTGAVTSSTPFSTCPDGGSDPRCAVTVTVLVPALALGISSDVASTTQGGVVHYTVTATNTGQTPYAGISAAVDLAGVRDDAVYNSDATASTGNLNVTGGALTWSFALPVGGSATVTFSATVRNPDPGDRSLRATVTSSAAGSGCPTPTAESGCASTVPVLLSSLLITKTASATTVEPGATIGYTITVLNDGQTTQTAASINDALSSVLTGARYNTDAVASVGTVSYTAPNLGWTGTLAPNAAATINYSVTLNDPNLGDQTLVNTVTSTTLGSNCPAGGTDPRCRAAVTVLVPSLTVTTAADADYASPGQTVRYTITVTNDGESTYPAATVTAPLAGLLDDATDNTDAAANRGTVTVDSSVRWTGALSPGDSARITFSVTVNPTAGDNQLVSPVVSTNSGTNCVSGSTDPRCTSTVPVARLAIQQGYTESSTTPGSLVHLNASFTNTGQYPYTGITVSAATAGTVDDATPTGDQVASAGTLILTSTQIVWTGSIPVGATITITGTLTVQSPDNGDRLLTGTLVSTAPGNNCPPGGTDPRCTANLQVLVPQLTVTKTANATFVVPGGTTAYTITVANTGQTPYTGASISDSLVGILDDATYNANATASTGSVSYTASTLSWTGDLAVGATATISYSVTAKSPATGDKAMINPVSSTDVGSTCPPASGSAACRTAVAVLTPALTIVKTASVANATLGSTVGFSIVVTNTGQTPYSTAAFSDPLSDVLDDATYLADLAATSGRAAYASSTVSWSGALAVGASATISYSVRIRNPDPGNKTMVNTVTSSTVGSNCATDSLDTRCTATVSVTNTTTVTYTKTADVAYATPGSVVRYTTRVANAASITDGLTFTDPLAGVLDDATFNDDLEADGGTATLNGSTITWTSPALVPVGSITITYSVTVNAGITGDQILANTVTGSSPSGVSNNCAADSTDPRCTTTLPIARLRVEQGYTQTSTTPGSLVRLNASFTNTGTYAYNGISVTSPSADTVDDATATGDQTASSGSLVLTSTAITWTGDIPVGATITITGTLTVQDPSTGNKLLTGTLVTSAPGSNCAPNSADRRCTASLPVLLPQLTITKTGDTTFVVPGGRAGYTITVRNSGQTPYVGATVTDSLVGVLDDASFDNNAVASGGALVYAAPTLTWTGDLAVGASVTITYSVTARTTSAGNDKTMINPVSSTDVGSTCPPATDNAACRTSIVVLTPALTFAIAATPASAVPGGQVGFSIVVRNIGQTPYPTATFSVPLAGVSDDAIYAGDASATAGSVSVSGGVLTWTGPLALAATATISYSVTVRDPDLGDHRLSQTITSTTQGSICPTGGSDPRCSSVVPVAGLELRATSSVTTAKPTDVVAYTSTFTNTGQVPYYGITVVDDLADTRDDATYNGDLAVSHGNLLVSSDTGQWSWTGDIPVGATVTITGSVTVDNPPAGNGFLRSALTTSASGSNCPPGGSDARCRTAVELLTPELDIVKTASTTTTTPGGVVRYTVTIDNTGETAYANAVVRDALDGGADDATYSEDAVATSGTVVEDGSQLIWTGNLAVGQTVVISYTVRVNNPDLGDKRIVNAVVSDELGSSCPTASAAPQCTTTVTVLVPALAVTLTADTTTTTPGSSVGYTLTIRNTGQTPYLGAAVTVSLAGALDDAAYAGDAVATSGSVAFATPALTWTGDLATGATATVSYRLVVADPDPGDRQLTSVVSSTAPGSSCSPGSPCTQVVSVLVPALAVATTADRATATPDDTVRFTVTVTNTGETAYSAAEVTVDLTDLLDDAELSGAPTASGGTAVVDGSTVTWTGALPVGDTVTLRFGVVVAAAPAGNRVLTATAVSDAAGSSCRTGSGNAACTATVTVLIPRLTVTKTADRTTTVPGGVVTYTILISNDGETPQTGVSVRDSLAGVLADAVYDGNAAVTGGGVLAYAAPVLTWTGTLPVGASATLTYSITVRDPDPGGKLLDNEVTSTAPGSTCPPVNPAASCRTQVPVLVPALDITKTASTTAVVAGSAVQYTVTVTNTGQTPYAPATLTDDLSAVLDDAAYAGDAVASVGTIEVVGDTLAWSGPLALGAIATITYSVVADLPATGDRVLTNTVLSTSAGATCTALGTPATCSTRVEVLVPALQLTKIADRTRVVAGSAVTYTIEAVNSGESDFATASFSDALTGVLDDAVYAGDASATSGTVGYAGGVLTWTGPLARGATVLVTFSVTTTPTVTGDGVLTNRVVSTTAGSTCPDDAANARCSTSTAIDDSTLTLTGLTPSFTLTGPPDSTVEQEAAVTLTVTTNNPGGYTVLVRGTDQQLRAASGSTDTIGLERLGVRASGSTDPFQPLSTDQGVLVHRQDRASAPGGDAVSTDYQVRVPFVDSDRYSTTLEYIVTAQ